MQTVAAASADRRRILIYAEDRVMPTTQPCGGRYKHPAQPAAAGQGGR